MSNRLDQKEVMEAIARKEKENELEAMRRKHLDNASRPERARDIANLILLVIVALLPLALALLLYDKLPDQVPAKVFAMVGEVTYDSKSSIWLPCALTPILAIGLYLFPRVDKRKASYLSDRGLYTGICAVTTGILTLINVAEFVRALHPDRIALDELLVALLGLFFAYFGNYMPKFKRNFFVGLKTPWMITDQQAFAMSQWVGGRMMFWLGVALCAIAFLLEHTTSYLIICFGVVAMLFIPSLVSYLWFEHLRKKEQKTA